MAYSDVVKREIKRLAQRPLGMFLAFIFPFLMCLIICFIFAGSTPKDLPIGVYNADNSQFSRLLVRNLNSLSSCKVKYQLTNLQEGETLLTEGKIYGFVVIPKNFQRDIYRLVQPKLVFYYNNQRILIGGIISKDISLMAQSMIVGVDATIRSKHGLPFKDAIKQANLINVVEHVRSNPYFNYQYFLSLVAFGHILQICIVFVSVWAIGTEFKYGEAKEWLKEADNSILTAFLGKMTPYLFVILFLFAILYLIYFGIYQVPYVGNFVLGIIATILFIITCLFAGAIFMSINGNFRYCLSFSAFYVAMGFALSGWTYPVMSMPLIAKIYSATSPLNYWLQVMIDQSLRKIPIVYDLKYLMVPLIIILIAFASFYRLKKLALDETRWYKI